MAFQPPGNFCRPVGNFCQADRGLDIRDIFLSTRNGSLGTIHAETMGNAVKRLYQRKNNTMYTGVIAHKVRRHKDRRTSGMDRRMSGMDRRMSGTDRRMSEITEPRQVGWFRRPQPAASVAARAAKSPFVLSISAEAAIRFAALNYDPRHLTGRKAGELAESLFWFGIHSKAEHFILAALAAGIAAKDDDDDVIFDEHDFIAMLELWPDPPRHRRQSIQLLLNSLRRIESLRGRLPPPSDG